MSKASKHAAGLNPSQPAPTALEKSALLRASVPPLLVLATRAAGPRGVGRPEPDLGRHGSQGRPGVPHASVIHLGCDMFKANFRTRDDVKIWFQNRRTKWKKQDGISNAEAAELKIGEKSTKSKCSAAKAGAPLAADALAKGPASGAGGASPLLPASSNSSSALTVNQQSFSGSAKPSPCGVSDLSNLSSSGDRTDDSSQHYPPSSDPEKFENGALAANHDGANGAGVALACRDSPSLADERPFRDAVDQVPIQRVPKQGTDAAFVLVAASPVLSCDAADKFQDSSQVEQ
ncbi:hypothetical protein HPB47_019295 [Ixodes persulcatus]|uniref:Uncharacterized protein n=1 Tax=Ixodes persulcatus TaxID=34615 RepID=A0AC60QL39_IXOPE|nr:hypothetical protein HPB47_019295 [Ixodes persulcatus]